MFRRVALACCLFLVLPCLLTEACSSATAPRPRGPAVVKVFPDSATMAPGDTLQVILLTPVDFGYIPTVHWSSSDPAVAAVDTTGLVTALDLGQAVIRAAGGGAKDSLSIRVTPAP
jgi:uncharacterized protein YjdB